MKRIIMIVLSVLICFSFSACSEATNDVNNQENSNLETEQTANDVALSPENIYDYLVFDVKLENIKRYSSASLSGETASGFSSCDVVLNVYAKKPVEFDGLAITFDLVPSRNEYDSIVDKELQLKYDGTGSDTYKYRCETEGENPEFEVVVKETTGKIIEK